MIGVEQVKGVQQLVERDHKGDGREHDADQDEQADNRGSFADRARTSHTRPYCQRYIEDHHPDSDDQGMQQVDPDQSPSVDEPLNVGCGEKKNGEWNSSR